MDDINLGTDHGSREDAATFILLCPCSNNDNNYRSNPQLQEDLVPNAYTVANHADI